MAVGCRISSVLLKDNQFDLCIDYNHRLMNTLQYIGFIKLRREIWRPE